MNLLIWIDNHHHECYITFYVTFQHFLNALQIFIFINFEPRSNSNDLIKFESENHITIIPTDISIKGIIDILRSLNNSENIPEKQDVTKLMIPV